MTRGELWILAGKHNLHTDIINLLADLKLIEIDGPEPPKTPMEKLENALRRRYFTDNNIADIKLALGANNLEVVEKTKR